MKIAVVGLWHLGCVTAACLSKIGHDIIAFDPDADLIASLKQGKPPIFEPDLTELLNNAAETNKLTYTSQTEDLKNAEIIWITLDTPVNDNDTANSEFVLQQTKKIFPYFESCKQVIISSQLPVGSTRTLQNAYQKKYPHTLLPFSYIPENLRLGNAIQVFMHPDRIIVGIDKKNNSSKITELFSPITDNLIFMSIESAEMTKHALNTFLATSVVFMNEFSTLCEQVGADAYEVEQGLKSEERIGQKAYLRPGGAIGGGTLLRDVNFLHQLSHEKQQAAPLISALLESNALHKTWLQRKINTVLPQLKNKTIGILGLTYKPNTNTLRRSVAIETAQWLHEQGAKIHAYDPSIETLPTELTPIIQLKKSIPDLLKNIDALVIGTEWPVFKDSNIFASAHLMNQPYVFDPSSFLMSLLTPEYKIHYYTVGKSS